jgi:probable phosphoglycerate mutase
MNKYRLSKNIYLFRHGETNWNKLKKPQGCENDIPLNDNGRKQSESIGKYISDTNFKVDLIISSNMSRANETAQIIANSINYKLPILIIDNLKEICRGKLAGLSTEELKSNKEFDRYFELEQIFINEKDPLKQRELFYLHEIELHKLYGTELYRDSRHRIKKALKEIYNREEQNIIIVSHSGTIQRLLQFITNITDNIEGNFKYGHNCNMSYIQLFEKQINNKIKRKIKIIKYLTSEHLQYKTNSIIPNIKMNSNRYTRNLTK